MSMQTIRLKDNLMKYYKRKKKFAYAQCKTCVHHTYNYWNMEDPWFTRLFQWIYNDHCFAKALWPTWWIKTDDEAQR